MLSAGLCLVLVTSSWLKMAMFSCTKWWVLLSQTAVIWRSELQLCPAFPGKEAAGSKKIWRGIQKFVCSAQLCTLAQTSPQHLSLVMLMWACERDLVNSSCAVTYLGIWRSSTYPEKTKCTTDSNCGSQNDWIVSIRQTFLGFKNPPHNCIKVWTHSSRYPPDVRYITNFTSLTHVSAATLGWECRNMRSHSEASYMLLNFMYTTPFLHACACVQVLRSYAVYLWH